MAATDSTGLGATSLFQTSIVYIGTQDAFSVELTRIWIARGTTGNEPMLPWDAKITGNSQTCHTTTAPQ